MHALKRFGTAFGGYKMMENYPVPECGPDDIILEIKAAAICGADMKHWGVDNGYDDTNITPDQQQSVRGHEFAGEIDCSRVTDGLAALGVAYNEIGEELRQRFFVQPLADDSQRNEGME